MKIITYLFFITYIIIGCKTNEPITPSVVCRLHEYQPNTYTESPNYLVKLTYNENNNLVLHKSETPISAVPIFILPSKGFKDSITYKNDRIDKIYRFQYGVNKFLIDRIESYLYNTNNQIAKIVQQIYEGAFIYSTKESIYSYKDAKIDLIASETKRAIYGPYAPDLNPIPIGSVTSNIDTTYYVFSGNNLTSKTTKMYELRYQDGNKLLLTLIQDTFFSNYDDKVNPLYQLPIESKIFETLSINNYRTKKDRTRIAVVGTENQDFFTTTHSFEYDSKGLPINVNSNVLPTVLVQKNIPFFKYNCK